MMWRMLGADHPMEAHQLDSRGMFHRGRRRREGGHLSFLEKRPARFTDTVSGRHAALFPVVAGARVQVTA